MGLHFTLLQFVNAAPNKWPMSDATSEQCTGESNRIESNRVESFLNRPTLVYITDPSADHAVQSSDVIGREFELQQLVSISV